MTATFGGRVGAADDYFAKARQVLQVLDAAFSDYAIELYLMGLDADPDDVEGHRELRQVALRRRAAGGKPMGLFMKMKTQSKAGADDKSKMLALEKLLAYEPADLPLLAQFILHARAAGCTATADWAQSILDAATGE